MKHVTIPEELKRLHPFWNAWHIEGVLGSGAYGKVFRIVKHDRSGIYEAALKWIPLPENEQELDLRRSEGLSKTSIDRYYSDKANELEQEIKLLSRFKGTSHIVSYEDHLIEKRKKSTGWDILIRMELLTPLGEYLSHSLVTCRDIVSMGIDLCDALSLCHRNNVLHRDIKPANIFRSGNGDFKLGDFGISRKVESKTDKLTQIGTWDYMAPEVKMGSSYGAEADIYSLGLVMYKALNASHSSKGQAASGFLTAEQNDQAAIRLLQGEALPKPKYGTDALWIILQKACALLPGDRYEDAAGMRKDLEAVENDPALNQVISSGHGMEYKTHQANGLTGTGTILIPGGGRSTSRQVRTTGREEG